MSIIAVNTIAAIQLIVGDLLVPTGFGATIGMGLISEVVTDLFTTNRAYFREFSWSDYIKFKSVSLVISAASAGWKSMKDAVIGGKNFITGSKTVLTGGKVLFHESVENVAKRSSIKLRKTYLEL